MHKLKEGCLKACLFYISFFIATSLLFACKSSVPVRETAALPLTNGKLLILPFKDMSAIYGENVSLRCPLCGNVFMTGEVTDDAEDILTQSLVSLMESRKGVELMPSGHAHGVWSEMLSRNEDRLSERDQIFETGRILGADLVMAGYIYRFRERIGVKYSADSPASAAFDVHLVDVNSRRILWTGRFDETQGSLFENLFKIGTFLKRKGAWVTVNKMAVSALEDMLQTLVILNTEP
ncbi:MAG: hypothetical protein U9R02_13860 [Thermodesulfobacteriota bacterium]|nr:hypothetical protein [Thermodesulfobacteriota bacterium]